MLHEEVDEVFLLVPDLPEVVEVLPHIDVEVVLDAVEQGPLPRFGDVVVIPWVVGLAVWNLYGDLTLLLLCGEGAWGLGNGGPLQHLALNGASAEGHGVVASVAVYEPLAEIRWHFQVDAEFGHDAKMVQTECKETVSFAEVQPILCKDSLFLAAGE